MDVRIGLGRHGGPGARSAPERGPHRAAHARWGGGETGNQPTGSGRISRGGAPWLAVLLLATALPLAGCRQADGPLPPEDGETPNRLADIARDLQNVAAGQSDKELADDLVVFVEPPSAEPAVRELSRRVSQALGGRNVTPEAASELARQLWLAVGARELSPRQVAVLQEDVQKSLAGLGVSEERAQPVVEQIAEVQRLVTRRQKRWYELF